MSMDLFKGYGIPVKLADEETFLKVKETLTRMGIASRKDKTITQSCNILHKKGYYHILHFKEMFLLDGRTSDITDADLARRNTIALLLEEWGLVKILDKSMMKDHKIDITQLKIISYSDKDNWNCVSKYTVGNKKF